MAQISVRLPSGELQPMTYPDDWSQDQVKEAIYKHFPDAAGAGKSEIPSVRPQQAQEEQPQQEVQQPEETGFKGLGMDAIESLRNTLKGGIGFLQQSPGNLKDLASAAIDNPVKAGAHNVGQLAAAFAEGGKGILNLPHKAIGELGRKELIPDWLKKYNELPFTHIPEDTGVEKALGLQPTRKGDEIIRSLPTAFGLGSVVAKGASKGAAALKAPSKEVMFQRALERGIQEAKEAHNLSKAEVDQLRDNLSEKFSDEFGTRLGTVTPSGLKVSANVKTHEANELKPLTEIPEEHVGEIPEAPDTEAIIAKKKSALESAQKEAESIVGIKDNPRLAGGAKVKKAIEAVRDKASDLYKAARAHYVDKNIKVDNSKEIKDLGKEVNELSANEGIFEGAVSEREDLQAKINSLEGETVSASDIFDLQRSLEKMAENTRNKQYASGKGTTDLERKRYGLAADRLEYHARTLEKRLESVGGEEVQAIIKDANKGWKTWKDLEKRNPVGKAALKGELPVRTMVEVAKSHPGNDFLSALIESDPELKKHVLASYTGESNVNKLLKPTSLAKKYIESLPEVEEHVNALKQALTGVKEGDIQASKVKKEYDALVTSMKDAAKRQAARTDAIKKSDALKAQIKFINDAIPKVESKIKAAEEKGLEHAKLDKELADHKQNLQDKNYKLKKYGNIILKLTGATSIAHKLGL